MKCQKCGTEFEGNFCPKCGTKGTSHSEEQIGMKKEEKKRWYLSFPIIFLSFLFCLPISFVLTIIRLKSIKEQHGTYRITTIIAVLLHIVMIILFIFSLTYTEPSVKEDDSVTQQSDYSSVEKGSTEEITSAEITGYRTIFDCNYPKAFSSQRKKILKLVKELNDELIDGTTINLETKDEVSFKQTVDITEYKYFGDLKGGKPDGKGVIVQYYEDYLFIPVQAGYFKNGKLDGYGMQINKDGIWREGEYKKGLLSGKGIGYNNWEISSVNLEHESDIRDNYWEALQKKIEQKISQNSSLVDIINKGGGFVFADFPVISPNVSEEGEYKRNQLDGDVKLYYSNYSKTTNSAFKQINSKSPYGPLKYEGEAFDDRMHGKGTLFNENGTICYKGEFKYGKYHGKGTLYNDDGSVKYKGKFKNGDVD